MFTQKSNLRANHWCAGSYVRLSREDGDMVESDSIQNQKVLIREYVENHPEIELVDEYTDDGFTGTNFERPSFTRMMMDIEEHRIDCVIVKDLSRFGRNYIEVGRFLERIFPLKGIRFIAITDGIDSEKEDGDADQLIIPFKNLINDSYCRDISIKVRAQKEIKRRNGQFMGSFAPYGYKKDDKDKNHLVIDETAADVVRLIFGMKLEGYSNAKIAKKLDENHIPTPFEYKRSCGYDIKCGFRSGPNPSWSVISIIRILKDEVYKGNMVQGKRRKLNYKLKETRFVAPEEWVRVENTHEPLISGDVFDTVQEILKRDTRTSPYEDRIFVLSGYVKCGDCGETMIRRSSISHGKKYFYYHCARYARRGGCSSHIMSEKKLFSAIQKSIAMQINMIIEADEYLSKVDKNVRVRLGAEAIEKQIEIMKAEELRHKELLAKLYSDMREGVIGEEEYSIINERFGQKVQDLEKAIMDQMKKKEELLARKKQGYTWIEQAKKYQNCEQLTREMVVTLIDNVYIYGNDRIVIHFRYEDEVASLMDQYYMLLAAPEKTEPQEGLSA